MKCANCWREVERAFPDVIYNEWLKLIHYIEHEYHENEISEASYTDLCDALMSLKPHEEE